MFSFLVDYDKNIASAQLERTAVCERETDRMGGLNIAVCFVKSEKRIRTLRRGEIN